MGFFDIQPTGKNLLQWWARFQRLPGGATLFSWALGRAIPYSGSIPFQIEKFLAGDVAVSLQERRSLHNHLNSVHAMALANLGELATGLALTTALDETTRGIVVGFQIEYLKKARGRLLATAQCAPISTIETRDLTMHGQIINQSNEIVAKVQVQWRIGPRKI